MTFSHSTSGFGKKLESMISSHKHDHADACSDDYALPSQNERKPWQHLSRTLPTFHQEEASEDDHVTLAEKEETSIRFDESDDEIMDLLGVQLEEEMMAIEEDEKMCHQETTIWVVFMGAATEKDKRACVQKLSQALLTRSRHKRTPFDHFKEKKHLVVGRLRIDEQSEDDCSVAVETFEDNGPSIIEADFSWSTGRRRQAVRFARLLLQCHNDGEALSFRGDQEEDAYDLHPRTEGNGIDICIYFYEDNNHSAAVEEDLAQLWQLQTMGVPILPILVGDVTGSDISTRRTQLADLLALHKICCKSFLTILDVGPLPSFTRAHCYQVKDGHTKIEKRLGSQWTVSKHTGPTPYDILTISQFSALNGHILSKHILEDHISAQKQRTEKDVSPLLPSIGVYHRSLRFWSILVITGMLLLFALVMLCSKKLSCVHKPAVAALHAPLTAQVSLSRHDNDYSFIYFELCGGAMACEQHRIPLPSYTQDDILALGTMYIDTNSSRVDIIKHYSSNRPPTTATKSPSDKEKHLPESYLQKEKQHKRWLEYYQTLVFVFKHRSSILHTIFTKTKS